MRDLWTITLLTEPGARIHCGPHLEYGPEVEATKAASHDPIARLAVAEVISALAAWLEGRRGGLIQSEDAFTLALGRVLYVTLNAPHPEFEDPLSALVDAMRSDVPDWMAREARYAWVAWSLCKASKAGAREK